MASELLHKTILREIEITDVKLWLSGSSVNQKISEYFEDNRCSRPDFILYILNFLREETKQILQRGEPTDTKSHCDATKKKALFPTSPDRTIDETKKKQRNRRIQLTYADERHQTNCKNAFTIIQDKSENNACEIRKNICTADSVTSLVDCHQVLKNQDSLIKSSKDFRESCITVSQIGNCTSTTFNSPEKILNILPKTTSTPKTGDSEFNRDHYKFNISNKKRSQCKSATSLTLNLSNNHQTLGSSKSNSQKRRIKPTKVEVNTLENMENCTTEMNFGSVSRPCLQSNLFQLVEEKPCDLTFERDLIRQEIKQKKQVIESLNLTSNKYKLIEKKSSITPNPLLVRQPEKLELLSDIYCYLLNNNLVVNIMSELYFIFSLLLACDYMENSSEDDITNQIYFPSIHECVYFAVSVLNNIKCVLFCLDTPTLRLISDNDRIHLFCGELKSYLHYLCDIRNSDVTKKSSLFSFPSDCFNVSVNVSFQSETDNRQNFPSDSAFSAFRKQRDLFYEMLQNWEVNHESSTWNFANVIGPKIQVLFKLHEDPVNFAHFARLFRAQLQSTCRRKNFQINNEVMDEETFSLLITLKKENPSKYALLHDRLVNPRKSGGPCPVPTFPGQEEFYRDFIVHSRHTVFYQHLSDSLTHEILLLNDTEFISTDVDTDTSVTEITQWNYFVTVNMLRLLAKFLGFITFYPYICNTKIPENIVSQQCILRSQSVPSFDLVQCIEKATEEHKLTISLPWIVMFIAMVDQVALRLPYYNKILQLLFHIYMRTTGNKPADMLIRLCLGWVFEQPNIPEGIYFSWLSQQDLKALRMDSTIEFRSFDIDQFELVNNMCLQEWCSYLGEIKLLMISDPTIHKTGSSRHITPISAIFENTVNNSTKQLEVKLEENFFHGQPSSVRRSVEFVGERVASACVKHICNFTLHEFKEKAKQEAIITAENIISVSEQDFQAIKVKLKEEMNLLGEQNAKEFKISVKSEITHFCEKRSLLALKAILADDTLEPVINICSQIAVRISKERINSWMHSHIIGDLFAKDFMLDVNKLMKKSLNEDTCSGVSNELVSNRKITHKDSAVCPRMILNELRELVWCIINETPDHVTAEYVTGIIEKVLDTLRHRKDLTVSAEKFILVLTVDLALVMISHYPKLINPKLRKKFVDLWKQSEVLSFCEEILSHILSSRNVLLLGQSEHPSDTWLCMSYFLSSLLKENLLSVEAMEEQCLSLLRTDWPEIILQHFANCIQNVVKQYRLENHNTYDEFVLLMEFISEICIDMENLTLS